MTQPEGESNTSPNPIELAIPLAQRVRIRDVSLVRSRMERTPEAQHGLTGQRLEIAIVDITSNRFEDGKGFHVLPTFKLAAHPADASRPDDQEDATTGDDQPDLLIEATFVLTYEVDSFEGLEDAHLEAFAYSNGIYNAWPYWREFAQSCTARMGLRPITVPVFRLEDEDEETDEPTSASDAQP